MGSPVGFFEVCKGKTLPLWVELLALILCLSLFVALLTVNVYLAVAALLLWMLLDALMRKKAVLTERKPLLRTRRAVLASFSPSPEVKRQAMILSRGIRIPFEVMEPVHVISLSLRLLRRIARWQGRRRARGRGRPLGFTMPRGKYFKVDIAATLRRAAATGSWPRVKWSDLRMKLFSSKSRITMVVVLDCSASMTYSLEGIVSALKAVKREVARHRDRVALVVCKGFSSVVAQHPTTNINLLLGKISRLGLSDFTPLASGMHTGLNMALHELRRGYLPVLVVISDGNVNVPLPVYVRDDSFSDPAVSSVIKVAEHIAKRRVETLVINTRHVDPPYESREVGLSGTELLLKVARITRGVYVGLS